MSDFVSSTWQFVKRHKGKLILAGGTAGALIWMNKVMSNWDKSWETSASRDYVSDVRKKEIHFENTIQTCNSTCISLAPKILDILDSILDTEALVDQLKRSKSLSKDERVKLWEELKVRIFTRLAAEVYTVCLFACYLRVQLAVIGGYVYVDSSEAGTLVNLNKVTPYSDQGSSKSDHHHHHETCPIAPNTQHVQHKYLSLLQSFYQDGIHEILQPVQESVEHALEDWSLKDKVSLADLRTICDNIKSSMAFSLSSPSAGVSQYLIRPERLISYSDGTGAGPSTSSSSNSSSRIQNGNGNQFASNKRRDSLTDADRALLQRMLTETQDILESADFKRVLTASIDVGYSIMMDTLLGVFVRMSDEITLGGLEASTMGTSFLSTATSMSASGVMNQSQNMSMSISMLQSAEGMLPNGHSTPLENGNGGQEDGNGSDEGVEADEDSDKEQSKKIEEVKMSDLPNGGSFTNPHSIQIAMAKLLPAIRAAMAERKKPDEQLVLVRHLLCLDVLNCFAANIYEAFCVPPESK